MEWNQIIFCTSFSENAGGKKELKLWIFFTCIFMKCLLVLRFTGWHSDWISSNWGSHQRSGLGVGLLRWRIIGSGLGGPLVRAGVRHSWRGQVDVASRERLYSRYNCWNQIQKSMAFLFVFICFPYFFFFFAFISPFLSINWEHIRRKEYYQICHTVIQCENIAIVGSTSSNYTLTMKGPHM